MINSINNMAVITTNTTNTTIQEAINQVFIEQNIHSRDDLYNTIPIPQLYDLVKSIATTHWYRLIDPKASTRAHYGRILPGFANCP